MQEHDSIFDLGGAKTVENATFDKKDGAQGARMAGGKKKRA